MHLPWSPNRGKQYCELYRTRALIDLSTCRVRFVNESFFGRVGSYQSVKHDLELLNESVEQSLSLELNAVIDSLNRETKGIFRTSPIRNGPRTDE